MSTHALQTQQLLPTALPASILNGSHYPTGAQLVTSPRPTPPTYSLKTTHTSRQPPQPSLRLGTITGSVGHEAALKSLLEELLFEGGRQTILTWVKECFERVAPGAAGLNREQLRLFARLFQNCLAQRLRAPVPQIFIDMDANFLRFDLTATKALDHEEVMKLVHSHLIFWWWKKLGAQFERVPPVEFKTLKDANYRILRTLGEGGQGVVYLAADGENKQMCIKATKKARMSKEGLLDLQTEFLRMQFLANDALATISDIFQDSEFYFSVCEPYLGGDFTTFKERARSQGVQMTEDWWRSSFVQCFQALAYMHENCLMHCDIKEPNIMLKTQDFEHPEVVLIDFGFSRAFVTEHSGMVNGTFGYIPPETYKAGRWFPRGDMFALGVTIIQVLVDKIIPASPDMNAPPTGIFLEGISPVRKGVDPQNAYNTTLRREPPFHLMPSELQGLTTLLRRMLQKQIEYRLKAHEALTDPWLAVAAAGNHPPGHGPHSPSSFALPHKSSESDEMIQLLQEVTVDDPWAPEMTRPRSMKSRPRANTEEALDSAPGLLHELLRLGARWPRVR